MEDLIRLLPPEQVFVAELTWSRTVTLPKRQVCVP